PTMFPISEDGPYYAALLTGGTLDTKGGPKNNVSGQVVDDQGKPNARLYGVGNFSASASARAHWARGGAIGLVFGVAFFGGQCGPQRTKESCQISCQAR